MVAATVTSRRWREESSGPTSPATARFLRLAWITAGIAYLQLVLGAHLRHVPADWSPSMFRTVVVAHLVGAAVLTAHVAALGAQVVRQPEIRRRAWLSRPTWILVALLTCQLLLGAASWRLKYGWPDALPLPPRLRTFTITAEGMAQSVAVTAHVAVGSLIVAMSVLVALRGSRLFAPTVARSRLIPAGRHLEMLI
jgi:cytochrome c oxidase assembly protein subunit 15